MRVVFSAEPQTQSLLQGDKDGELPVGHSPVLCGPGQTRRYSFTSSRLFKEIR